MPAFRDSVHVLKPLAFVLLPVLGALTAHAVVSPPAFWILAKDVGLLWLATTMVVVLLVSCGWPTLVASRSISIAAIVLGLYPICRTLAQSSIQASDMAFFAAPYALVGLGLGIATLYRNKARASALDDALSMTSAVLALLMVWNVATSYAPSSHFEQEPLISADALRSYQARPPAEPLPDIYHVVFDGLGRADILQDKYGVDLTEAVNALRRRGVDVVDDATANYVQTALSVASVLNARYIDVPQDVRSTSRVPLYRMIQDSVVISFLKTAGYQITFLNSVFGGTQDHKQADTCQCGLPLIGDFESTILQGTVWNDLPRFDVDYAGHRRKIHETLSTLEHLEPLAARRYLFAHVIAPHPPFVVTASGAPHTPRASYSLSDGSSFRGGRTEYMTGYKDQATFVMDSILRFVDRIDAISKTSAVRPVIIIHGDHGPRIGWDVEDASKTDAGEAVPVFLAVRWNRPDGHDLPHSLVNVYRSLLKAVFNVPLTLLEDRSFVSSFTTPYQFLEIDRRVVTPQLGADR